MEEFEQNKKVIEAQKANQFNNTIYNLKLVNLKLIHEIENSCKSYYTSSVNDKDYEYCFKKKLTSGSLVLNNFFRNFQQYLNLADSVEGLYSKHELN